MTGAQTAWLPGGRLHLHHGPIDLVVGAEGPGRRDALRRAAERFQTVLDELVAELPALRRPLDPAAPLTGAVAQRMSAAVAPFAAQFVTPMAAVAGAVADEVLAALCAGFGVAKAYVNNGGDVAFHLADGQHMTAALAASVPGRLTITADNRARGMATSGWRGRSHSLGIADAVTVLADTAAAADAAATLIANAVDLPGHAGVVRAPANRLAPDSDLGGRLVTIDVVPLSPTDAGLALQRGLEFATHCHARRLIVGAVLVVGAQYRLAGALPALNDPQTEPLDA